MIKTLNLSKYIFCYIRIWKKYKQQIPIRGNHISNHILKLFKNFKPFSFFFIFFCFQQNDEWILIPPLSLKPSWTNETMEIEIHLETMSEICRCQMVTKRCQIEVRTRLVRTRLVRTRLVRPFECIFNHIYDKSDKGRPLMTSRNQGQFLTRSLVLRLKCCQHKLINPLQNRKAHLWLTPKWF